jgi:hypothetical protein
MDAHRAHRGNEVFHGQSLWWLITIGVALATVVAVLGIGLTGGLDETSPELRVPAIEAGVDAPFADHVPSRRGFGVAADGSVLGSIVGATVTTTDAREGSGYAAAVPTGELDAGTAIREGSGYADPIAHPQGRRCAAKSGC